jgi:N-acetylglucosamine kinase-like BadF-type ATPase
VFEQLAPRHFGYADPTALARALHAGELAEDRLGELAPLVFEQADVDAVAGAIVDRLADEVAALARAALTRLELANEEVDVVLGGSLLRAGNRRLLARIEDDLRAVGPAVHVTAPAAPPIVGAALLGLDDVGAGPRERARARRELQEAVAGLAGAAAIGSVSDG